MHRLGTYSGDRIPVASLYSGAGGLDLGFRLAGFESIFANDIDRHAVETFNRINGRDVAVAGDISGVLLPRRGAAEVVIGGPPCQGFSVAGRMDPNDPRSEHVWRFFDVVEALAPRAFVMENVKALALSERWAPVRYGLLRRARSLGYNVDLWLLTASNYGVPQARDRMFLIGVKGAEPRRPRAVTPGKAAPTVRSVLEALPLYGAPGNDNICTARVTPAINPVLRRSPWAGMLFNGQGRPMNLDAPAPTLPASMGGNRTPIVDQMSLESGEPSWVIQYHEHLWAGGPPVSEIPSQLRRITVQEAAAIQTFPTGLDWSGSQSAVYRQIGNAVPPFLAYFVAQAIRVALGYGTHALPPVLAAEPDTGAVEQLPLLASF